MDRVKDWVEQYWKVIGIGGIGLLFLLLLFIAMFLLSNDEEEGKVEDMDEWVQQGFEENDRVEEENMEMTKGVSDEPSLPVGIMVDIKGAVHSPGVYQLEEGARLLDAVELAGGLVEEADSRSVNLAQQLTDQMMIYIPLDGEDIPETVLSIEETKTENEISQGAIININTADENTLTQLNGIGDKRARTIIDYREENGLFQSKEDIMNVSGIGEGIFANIEDEIIVSE